MYKIEVIYQNVRPILIKKRIYASKKNFLRWKEHYAVHYAEFGSEYKVRGYVFTGLKWKEYET